KTAPTSAPTAAQLTLFHASGCAAPMATHSITSSASASSVGGISRPSAPSRRKVDDKLELARLNDRKVGWLFALEHSASVSAVLPISIREAASVTHQTTGCHVLTPISHRRHPMTRRQRSELGTLAQEECVEAH